MRVGLLILIMSLVNMGFFYFGVEIGYDYFIGQILGAIAVMILEWAMSYKTEKMRNG